MSRYTQPREQKYKHSKEEFDYPFGCIDDLLEERTIPHIEQIPYGDFPKNIKRWIWSSAGQNDEMPWWLLAELESDDEYPGVRYAFYDAWCDYTGFDCQGGMSILVAPDIETLIQYGLTEAAYKEYMKDTEPSDSW